MVESRRRVAEWINRTWYQRYQSCYSSGRPRRRPHRQPRAVRARQQNFCPFSVSLAFYFSLVISLQRCTFTFHHPAPHNSCHNILVLSTFFLLSLVHLLRHWICHHHVTTHYAHYDTLEYKCIIGPILLDFNHENHCCRLPIAPQRPSL